VVGSDNDPLLCELGPVPLSSVDNRKRDQGFRAAKLLDQLISGAAIPTRPIRVPSGPVIVRHSSEVLAVSDPDLSKALKYIAEHYSRQSISVQEVVRHVDITRRRLYSLFEQHLGRPIHAEILRRRLDLARRLLLTTRQKLYWIARACGFQGAQQFTRVFTRELGIPPSRYRQREGHVLEEKAD
jgi:LacI family transcriptional regulator